MLQQCCDIFKEMFDREGLSLLMRNYTLSEGYYFVWSALEGWQSLVVKKDKKTGEMIDIDATSPLFQKICRYDYCSHVLEANKTYSNNKLVYTFNYLSFGIKEQKLAEGKITKEIVDSYFDAMSCPRAFYKKGALKQIYETFEFENGDVDVVLANQMRDLVQEKLANLDIDLDAKNQFSYIKFFMDAPFDVYEREMYRYLCTHLFADSAHAKQVEGVWYGPPCQNFGIDGRLPFKKHFGFATRAANMMPLDDIYLQQFFFDFLIRLYNEGRQVYVDVETRDIFGEKSDNVDTMQSGYLLSLEKDKKGIHIMDVRSVARLSDDVSSFVLRRFIDRTHASQDKSWQKWDELYHAYSNRHQMLRLITFCFFRNVNFNQYTAKADDVSITDDNMQYTKRIFLQYRDALRHWQFTGDTSVLQPFVTQGMMDLIGYQLCDYSKEFILRQLQVKWSLEKYINGGGTTMGDRVLELRQSLFEKTVTDEMVSFQTDEEYYFGVGQLAAYLLNQSESATKNQSEINTFLLTKQDSVLKEKLARLYAKYNYKLPQNGYRVKRLLAMVMGYEPTTTCQKETLVMGYACDNVMYIKTKQDMTQNVEEEGGQNHE